MSNTLLIESGPFETRVAVLENGRLVEVHIERPSEHGVVGNIYKGSVSRVVPGIQAAFVSIGLQRDAFLFAGDLQRSWSSEPESDDDLVGQQREQRSIASVVKEGEELLVQVVKDPLRGKGARISMQLSLPGRYLVLLPGASGVRISRRIQDADRRQYLEALLQEFVPEDAGLIVRTAGAERTIEELRRDLEWLQDRWQDLRARVTGVRAPASIYIEKRLAARSLRDLVDEETEEIWVEGRSTYDELLEYTSEFDPQTAEVLRLHEVEPSLFDRFGVEDKIARAMRRRVWLSSGGFIVIDPTEALVAIDVNSGRNTAKAELEETALETNLEAVNEVAREVRLRDLAGIIVVDFIDMIKQEHREAVVTALASALAGDRSRTQISEMSDFGLVAITRKRMRGGLGQQLTETCPCCSGDGRVKDAMTVGLEVERAIRRRSGGPGAESLIVRVHSGVKRALREEHGALWDTIRERVEGKIELQVADDFRLDEFEILIDG